MKKDFVGGGGYGQVYHGKWLGVKVAIKRFSKITHNKKALRDFIKEIEVVHSLRHPNIILYMGVSFDPNQQYYMVSEYAHKGSLHDILHNKKYKFDEDRIFVIAK